MRTKPTPARKLRVGQRVVSVPDAPINTANGWPTITSCIRGRDEYAVPTVFLELSDVPGRPLLLDPADVVTVLKEG